jgi:hypothetical protein
VRFVPWVRCVCVEGGVGTHTSTSDALKPSTDMRALIVTLLLALFAVGPIDARWVADRRRQMLGQSVSRLVESRGQSSHPQQQRGVQPDREQRADRGQALQFEPPTRGRDDFRGDDHASADCISSVVCGGCACAAVHS